MTEPTTVPNKDGNTRPRLPVGASTPRVVLLVAVVGLLLALAWAVWPRLSKEFVRETIMTTLAAEAEEAFVVTGVLTFSATVERQNDRTLLPGILNLSLGTTTATVRVPGRVAYGFDVEALGAEAIRYDEDGTVDVQLPRLSVFSVEPEMETVEIQTDVGWARLHSGSGQETEQAALRAIRPSMRATAERHLGQSETPQLNTAKALARMLTPPLVAAGLENPHFRFRLSSGAIFEVDGLSGDRTSESRSEQE